jgi:phage gpG-like protein
MARDDRGRFLPEPIRDVRGDLEMRLEWDLSDLDEGLAAVIRRGKDFSPFFRKYSPRVRKHQKDHGREKEGPDGKWPKLSRSYRRAKTSRRKRGKPVARGTLGKLTKSHRITVNDFGIEIASPIKWANVHQEGGIVGKGREVPARPFLWWTQRFANETANRALDWAWGVW